MKKLHIILAISIIVFGSVGAAKAQDEVPPVAVGIRANPDGAGVTAKFFVRETIAIEGMLNGSGGSFYNANGSSVAFVVLGEYNFIFPNPSFRVFLGPGAHVGSWKQYNDNNLPRQTVYGLDAIFGAEYVFPAVPIGISLDVKPSMNFYNGVSMFPSNTFGLGVRYYFGHWATAGQYEAARAEDGRH